MSALDEVNQRRVQEQVRDGDGDAQAKVKPLRIPRGDSSYAAFGAPADCHVKSDATCGM